MIPRLPWQVAVRLSLHFAQISYSLAESMHANHSTYPFLGGTRRLPKNVAFQLVRATSTGPEGIASPLRDRLVATGEVGLAKPQQPSVCSRG